LDGYVYIECLPVAAEWLAFLLRIRKISGSNLGTQTGHLTEVLVMVSSHAKAGTVPQIRPRPFPSTSNPIYYSLHPTGARGGAVGRSLKVAGSLPDSVIGIFY
jgi:hypothetical protein